jgi:hypothetical protein
MAKTEGGVMCAPTTTALDVQYGDLSGVETLDLSIAAPVPTQLLSFGGTENAAFSEEDQSWSLQPAGSVEVCLTLPNPLPSSFHGLALIFQWRGDTQSGAAAATVEVELNVTALVQNQVVPGPSFSKDSWFVQETGLQPGQNTITVKVPAGSGEVLLKSVSTMTFYTEMQEQSRWCWAAVSKNVSFFFEADSSWTQCKIVNTCFVNIIGETNCCDDPGNIACNRPGSLSQALSTTGSLLSFNEGPPPLDVIREQISAGRPVGVMINWSGNGAHFITVTGVGPAGLGGAASTFVEVEDTLNDYIYIAYGEMTTSYRGNGTASHYYLTEEAN